MANVDRTPSSSISVLGFRHGRRCRLKARLGGTGALRGGVAVVAGSGDAALRTVAEHRWQREVGASSWGSASQRGLDVGSGNT